MQLSKGQNTTVPGDRITVSVSWPRSHDCDADLSALLLQGGRVRSDDDFVFYNQAQSPDGSITLAGKTHTGDVVTDTLTCALADTDPVVDTVAVAVSVDGAPSARLADLGPITVVMVASAETFTFVLGDLSDETAAVTAELYRRNGTWKVRAVGQGYRDGLAGVARDFGITVDDEAPSPAPVPAADSGVDWGNPPVPAGYEI